MNVEHWWNDTDREKPKCSAKHLLVPLSPTQILHGLDQEQIRVSPLRQTK